jgi:hypothetical protein
LGVGVESGLASMGLLAWIVAAFSDPGYLAVNEVTLPLLIFSLFLSFMCKYLSLSFFSLSLSLSLSIFSSRFCVCLLVFFFPILTATFSPPNNFLHRRRLKKSPLTPIRLPVAPPQSETPSGPPPSGPLLPRRPPSSKHRCPPMNWSGPMPTACCTVQNV